MALLKKQKKIKMKGHGPKTLKTIEFITVWAESEIHSLTGHWLCMT